MSTNSTNNYTNLQADTELLRKYADKGSDAGARELSLTVYSIAERALRNRDISPQLATLQGAEAKMSTISIPQGLPLKAVLDALLKKAQPNTTNAPTDTNSTLASDVVRLQNYACNGINENLQDLCISLYSLAELALSNKDLSLTLKTLQDLNSRISNIFIPKDLPLKAVVDALLKKAQPDPVQGGISLLLQLPRKLLPVIFASLSVEDVGRLSLVCKVIEVATNNESLWEKLCKQENADQCQLKPQIQLWKDFCKNEMSIPLPPPLDSSPCRSYFRIGPKSIEVKYNKTDQIKHIKQRLHKLMQNPYHTREMVIVIQGKIAENSTLFKDYKPETLETCHLVKKKT